MRKNTLETREVKHQAYLLHLWREEQDDVWRASVKTTTGEKEVAFASLDELFVYLLRRTEANTLENKDEGLANIGGTQ